MSEREKERYERENKAYKEKMAKEAGAAADAAHKEDKVVGKKRPASSTPQKSKAKEEKKATKEAPAKKEKAAAKPAKKAAKEEDKVEKIPAQKKRAPPKE